MIGYAAYKKALQEIKERDFENAFNTSRNILEFNKNRDNMMFTGVRRIDDEA